MDKHSTDRTLRLEEAIAHMTRMIDDMNEVVTRQEGEIARLTRRVEMLMRAEAGREADAGTAIPLADQRPPHW